MAFNPNDSRYTFCCCCPARVGAVVLSTIETLVVGAKLYQALNIYFQTMDDPSIITVLSTILLTVLWGWYFASLVCIYMSLCRPRPSYVLPKLILIVVQLALLILSAIGILIYFSGAAHATNNAILKIYEHYSGDAVKEDEMDNLHRNMKYGAAGALGMIVLLTIYNLWFLFVMRAYYRYVKDKANATIIETTKFHPLPTAPPPPAYNPAHGKS